MAALRPSQDDLSGLPVRRSRPQKTSVVVARVLANEISRHGYPDGHRLPREHDMLERFDVSRATLREAIRVLEHHGVIEIGSGPAGPVVRTPSASALASTLALLCQINRVPVRDVLALRMAIEPGLAGAAASHASAEDLERLRTVIDEAGLHLDQEAAFVESSLDFHAALANACGNSLFALLVEALNELLTVKLRRAGPTSSRHAVAASHVAIYEAVAVGDATTAAAAMSRHLRAFHQFINNVSSDLLDAGVLWEEVSGW